MANFERKELSSLFFKAVDVLKAGFDKACSYGARIKEAFGPHSPWTPRQKLWHGAKHVAIGFAFVESLASASIGGVLGSSSLEAAEISQELKAGGIAVARQNRITHLTHS